MMNYNMINWYLNALDRLMRELSEKYRKFDRACYKRGRAAELMRVFNGRNRNAYFRACYMYGWFKSKVWCLQVDIKTVEKLMNDYKAELEKLGEQF